MCDGTWEHLYGITINTLDNPGWHVQIDLHDTCYGHIEMDEMKRENGEHDWIFCSIRDGVFDGVGDSTKLEEILVTFKDYIENGDMAV